MCVFMMADELVVEKKKIVCVAVTGFSFDNKLCVAREFAYCTLHDFSENFVWFVHQKQNQLKGVKNKTRKAFRWQSRNQHKLSLLEPVGTITENSLAEWLRSQHGCVLFADSPMTLDYIHKLDPLISVFWPHKFLCNTVSGCASITQYCGFEPHKNNSNCALKRALQLAHFVSNE